MKKVLLTVIAAGLTATTAMATNINLDVQQTNGVPPNTNAITVAPGATVDYRIVGTLTDDLNEGLALIGLSLDFTGGPLTPANTPLDGDFTCQNPMRNFVKPEGMTNPNPGGYGGTVIGGDLIQAGGAQNTINNDMNNASFPIGTVLPGVAKPLPEGCGPAVILTGSFVVPADLAPDVYFLKIIQDEINYPFANVIVNGEDGAVFWATELAGIGTVINLTVTVAAPCDVAKWESVLNHTRLNQADMVVPVDIPDTYDNPRCTGAGLPHACCTGVGTGTCTGSYSESRSGIKKVLVTFNGTINAATATAANVIVCGNDVAGSPVDLVAAGVVVTASAVAGNTQMEINFDQGGGLGLPNYARYRIALSGVECSGGGAAQAGAGGLSRILTALQGDANGDRRVTTSDLSMARGLVFPLSPDPIDPAVLNQVRSDTNADKRVTVSDLSLIRGKVNNDARNIPDPVCP